jgi:23S rRNA (cytosine1962-C5)-methyltransferase
MNKQSNDTWKIKTRKNMNENKKFYNPKKPRIVLKKGKAKPFWNQNPWVFSGAIQEIRGGQPEDGDLVEVLDDKLNFIAKGYVSLNSSIRVRLITWQLHHKIDKNFYRDKIKEALYYRNNTLLLRTKSSAFRLIHGESDGIPGLIVDKYNDFLVAQFLTPGIERRKDMFLKILKEETRAEAIMERYSSGYRTKEGLPEIEYQIHDNATPPTVIPIKEYDLPFEVDWQRGQNTGFYLDQRENRLRLSKYANNKNVLDAFCYTGAFGIYMAVKGKAKHVTFIDNSNYVLEQAKNNAQLNKVQNATFQQLDLYKTQLPTDMQYDMIILDTPRLLQDQASVEQGKQELKQLYTNMANLLTKNGILAITERSNMLNWNDFLITFNQAMQATDSTFRIIETSTAGPDYPLLPICWEQTPLKMIIVAKI